MCHKAYESCRDTSVALSMMTAAGDAGGGGGGGGGGDGVAL